MTANFSSCENVSRGDVTAVQLVVRFENGRMFAETLGNKNISDSYRGVCSDGKLVLHAKHDNHQATIEASAKNSSITGRRIVGNSNSCDLLSKKDMEPCVILYDLSARKL